ncbi:hypothetical protein BBK82_04925 [Lentzea guizhouensis]|uniref:Uncharacterized protein n=1 Tax=Lentzea guizhouensis TaxID=1586287 RepID=A0A1B2HCT7_9PSEU|nr:hypothetical protein [Lentzea guizhouensis]ANZ35519.1 hypothetical protein BBK82_04925 [Lentzea guizhouensis]
MSDHWGQDRPTIKRATEGVKQLARCSSCQTTYWRPKGSDKTHAQAVVDEAKATDPQVDIAQLELCPPDAQVTNNLACT